MSELNPFRLRNEVHVRATWECAACPASALRSYMVPVEDLMLRPPEGWTVVLGMAYCPRHKVEVRLTHTNVIEMPAREAGKE